MDPREVLAQRGGVARSADLLASTTRRRLAAAVASGDVVRLTRGRYALPDADRALTRAAQLGGVASHLSAALIHGWEVLEAPTRPWVTVPPKAKIRDRRGVHLAYAEVDGRDVTGCLRTVVDCARRLPFAEALAVADSAVRQGDVDPIALAGEAAAVRGKGAARARLVARHADGRAANPFESALRAIALGAGLDVEAEAQGAIEAGGRILHPDLVDREHRLVIEAESWTWHGGRAAFERDCWRYTVVTLADWRVLRFTPGQVRHEPAWIVDCLRAAVGRTRR